MKKLFIALMCMLLVACSGKPSGYSKEAWEVAQKAIEIGEAYVDDKIDADSAISKLDRIIDEAEALTEDVQRTNQHYKDSFLASDIKDLQSIIGYSFTSKYDVEQKIKRLKGQ